MKTRHFWIIGALLGALATWAVAQAPIAGPAVAFSLANLGTPTSLTLTNATGLPPAGVVGTAATLGANTFTGTQTLASGGILTWSTRTQIQALANGYLLIGNSAGTAYSVMNFNVPGSTGFGTSPIVLGTVYMGSVNVGTGGIATTGSITFASDGVANHFCTVTDNTHPSQNTAVSCVASATSMALTFPAGATSDVLTWHYTGSI